MPSNSRTPNGEWNASTSNSEWPCCITRKNGPRSNEKWDKIPTSIQPSNLELFSRNPIAKLAKSFGEAVNAPNSMSRHAIACGDRYLTAH